MIGRLAGAFLAVEYRPALCGAVCAAPFIYCGSAPCGLAALTLFFIYDLASQGLRRRRV